MSLRTLSLIVCGLLFTLANLSYAQEEIWFNDLQPIMPENLYEVALLKVWTSEIYPDHLNLSPDNRTLAVFSPQGDFLLYDVETIIARRISGGVSLNRDSPYPLFTSDSRFVVILGSDETLRIWEVATGAPIASIAGQSAFVLNDETGVVATTGHDYVIHLWNVETGEELATLQGHTAEVWNFDLSPNDSKVISVSLVEPSVRVWDVESQSNVELSFTTNPNWGVPRGVVFNRDGSQFALQFLEGISVWDTGTLELLAESEREETLIWAEFFSVDDETLITVTYEEFHTGIDAWDLETGQQSFSFEAEDHAEFIDFNADESLMLIHTSSDAVRLYNTETGTLQRQLRSNTSGLMSSTFFSDDGRLLLGQVGRVITIFGAPGGLLTPLPYALVPAVIHPSSVNLRAEPSFDAEIIGTVTEGTTIVGGRDATGEFLYLLDYQGWVIAEDVYLTLINNVTMEDLPVLPSDVNAQ